MILLGLSGTNGSGKDSLAQFLVEEHNFLFVSSSDLLREEARKRGLGVERDILRDISAEWRRQSGLGVLVDKAIETYKSEGGDVAYAGLITGSLRNPGEADHLHELKGKMIWLDADSKVRFNRITSKDRGRGDLENNHSYEKFIADEVLEMDHSGDHATLSLAGVKDRCDIFIENDSQDISTFNKLIAKSLGL
ncbi:MAG: ATP-binding protein [bacterium]